MNKDQEYNERLKYRTNDELRKSKKYNCDGICYGNKFMCPRADTCEETRLKEFLATLVSILFLTGFYIILIFGLCFVLS